MIRALSVAVLLVACGSKHTEPAAPAPHAAEQMSPEMTKFHDDMGERWHAPKGPQRTKDTCDAVPALRADADAIAKATPPTAANADTWTAATNRLVGAVAALDAACQANDAAKFEPAFDGVHDSFHAVMTAAGMHPEAHAPKM